MNKPLVPSVLVAIVLGVCASQTQADSYVSFNGGAVWTQDSDLSLQDFDSHGKHVYDLGYTIDLAIGKTFSNGLRGELEIPYRFSDIDEFTIKGSNPEEFDREISSLSLMVNAYYDFETGTSFRPFVGAGIGYSLLQIEGWTTHHDADVFAYQLMAGCSYAINHQFTLDLQYRFFGTAKPEFETNDPRLGHIRIDSEYQTNNLMLGLRFYF